MNPATLLRAGLVVPLLVGASACQDVTFFEPTTPTDPLQSLADPCIVVEPGELDFGKIDITQGEEADGPVEVTKAVTVRNDCAGDLELWSVDLNDNPGSAAFDILSISDVSLAEGEAAELVVVFAPLVGGDYSDARLLVESNDPERPVERVRLRGVAIAPAIEVTPDTFDYGAPYIGCEFEQPYKIRNTGTADLVVDDIKVFSPSPQSFSLDAPSQITIPPGANADDPVEVWLEYLPLDTVGDTANVVFYNNDPSRRQYPIVARGSGTTFGSNVDVFEQPIRGSTDILFTLDRSCSMRDDLPAVANEFDAFVNTLAGLDADFHSAVTIDNTKGCFNGSVPYIDRSFDAADAIDVFRTQADVTYSMVPYNGREAHQGFTLALSALAIGNISPGGCNDGFYRKNAFLSVVHISDEPDYADKYGYCCHTWKDYLPLIRAMKRDPDDVVVHAIGGDVPAGCRSATNTGYPSYGYYEAVQATGGMFVSICSSWSSNLEAIAEGSVSVNNSFELTQPPVPQTIAVLVDGIAQNVGWEYDVTTNAVVFESDFIPPGGSTVEVEYELLPDCEG